jgi:hypothetical protein
VNTTTTIRLALQQLRVALKNDDVIDLSDDELAELAELAADELVRRLPRYALEAHDLPHTAEPQIEAREDLLDAIRQYRGERAGCEEAGA